MFGTRDAQTVLSYYALGQAAVRQIEPVGNAGGWSGSRLWRLGDASGRELCLRRWPAEHPTADRLRLIHGVLRLVFDELPIIANPLPSASGSTFIEHAGHLWELTPWRPGRADYPAQPNRARLRAAVQSLARFHDLAARYKQCLGAPQTILDRQQRWKELQQSGLSAIERSLATPLGNEIDQRATRLLALAHKALESSQAIQSLAAGPELLLQPAIRDIHRDHVLFTGDEVTGLIDFGAMRIDTPLTDVARLVGSLAGDDREARQFAFDAYAAVRPLSAADRRMIGLLDESGLVLGALNWLIWLYVERRDMGPMEPIVRRLDEMLQRLESRTTNTSH